MTSSPCALSAQVGLGSNCFISQSAPISTGRLTVDLGLIFSARVRVGDVRNAAVKSQIDPHETGG